MKEGLALRDQARVIFQRPGAEDLAFGAMSDPERRSIPERRPGDCGRQHPLEPQVAAGYQPAQRQNDGRAWNDRAYYWNGFQQGGEEYREIGKLRMGRHKRNQWIEERSHKIPVFAAALRRGPHLGSDKQGKWVVTKHGKCQQSPFSSRRPIEQVKARRDSQGSLPKTGASTYLDDYATEL